MPVLLGSPTSAAAPLCILIVRDGKNLLVLRIADIHATKIIGDRLDQLHDLLRSIPQLLFIRLGQQSHITPRHPILRYHLQYLSHALNILHEFSIGILTMRQGVGTKNGLQLIEKHT